MMHIFSMKGKTKKYGIKPLKAPPVLYIPLSQHIGAPAIPIVEPGESVKKYQLIARAASTLSANIHAPVSGKVVKIEACMLADGVNTTAIILENDGREEEVELYPTESELSADQIVQRIRDCGIVGAGGAQFPTDLKYNPEGKAIHTFIINGTECEPYLSADYALMSQHTQEVLEGIRIANKVLNAKDIVITIEEQNKELTKTFAPFLKKEVYKGFRMLVLPNEYPQGGELQLIKSVTGIELARNKRPREIGVIVNNVGTIHAIYKAVVESKPLTSRIITLSGNKLEQYGNFEVLIGTPVSHILKESGVSSHEKEIILGGPMMGKRVMNPDAPILKGSSGVLLLKENKKRKHNCISCGYCVDVCPMHLMPMKFEEIYRAGKYFKLEKYNITNCIECAACEYICPSNVPLIASIKEGKNKLKELANAIE